MGELVYVLGRDGEQFSAGAEYYAVAHGKAAVRGGLWPQWYSFASRAQIVETDYCTIHRVGWPGTEYRSEYSLMYRHRLAMPIVNHLKDLPGPHVIHSFGTWGAAGILATRKLKKLGVDVKHVNTCYELMGPHTKAKLDNGVVRSSPFRYARQRLIYEWVRRSTIPIEKNAYRESDAVVVNYERLRDLIHSEYDESINVVNLPYAAATAFDPLDSTSEQPAAVAGLQSKDGPLIVATSRHMPRKGVDVLIRALARVRDDGHAFRAVLVGTGQLLEAHRQLVSELGLADRVALPGRVPTVGAYLRHADIFSLPSLAEGSGSMSVLEALQYGVPVVSSAVDGMTEDLTDGVDAVLVETGSVEDLHRGLSALVTDPALRERLGKAGNALYERRFSADAATVALIDFYAGLGLKPTRS
ncbi:MAG: glycosyltransferase family 4 protein [Thermoleophilaceae bacterium]|nr:glycosyltransferase family 4 protein [Thermoleophilaceae bacterium]